MKVETNLAHKVSINPMRKSILPCWSIGLYRESNPRSCIWRHQPPAPRDFIIIIFYIFTQMSCNMSEKLFHIFRNKFLLSCLPHGNITRYHVHWTENAIDPSIPKGKKSRMIFALKIFFGEAGILSLLTLSARVVRQAYKVFPTKFPCHTPGVTRPVTI